MRRISTWPLRVGLIVLGLLGVFFAVALVSLALMAPPLAVFPLLCLVAIGCFEFVLVCLWHLVTLVSRGQLFTPESERWAKWVPKSSFYGAAALGLACLGLTAWVVADNGDWLFLFPVVLGPAFMALMMTAMGGLAIILGDLLGRALDMTDDLSEVI